MNIKVKVNHIEYDGHSTNSVLAFSFPIAKFSEEINPHVSIHQLVTDALSEENDDISSWESIEEDIEGVPFYILLGKNQTTLFLNSRVFIEEMEFFRNSTQHDNFWDQINIDTLCSATVYYRDVICSSEQDYYALAVVYENENSVDIMLTEENNTYYATFNCFDTYNQVARFPFNIKESNLNIKKSSLAFDYPFVVDSLEEMRLAIDEEKYFKAKENDYIEYTFSKFDIQNIKEIEVSEFEDSKVVAFTGNRTFDAGTRTQDLIMKYDFTKRKITISTINLLHQIFEGTIFIDPGFYHQPKL